MKDIKDMNLEEVRQKIYEHALAINNDELYSLLDRLDELTRWIPVSERMPTEEDGKHIHIFDGLGLPFTIMRKSLGSYVPTHWKRITPPEGV
jgi:hypothetical protein